MAISLIGRHQVEIVRVPADRQSVSETVEGPSTQHRLIHASKLRPGIRTEGHCELQAFGPRLRFGRGADLQGDELSFPLISQSLFVTLDVLVQVVNFSGPPPALGIGAVVVADGRDPPSRPVRRPSGVAGRTAWTGEVP